MMSVEQLARLLDDQAPALILYARQWTTAPEDVVQEAFVKLSAQATSPINPVGWLYRVVRNAAIAAARSSRRRERHESVAAAKMPAWFVPAEDNPLDAVDAAAALEELPLRQREIIVAHLWGGRTFDQIAELTGLSASTAHRLYAAGLETLRERLGAPCRNKNAMGT